MEWYDGSPIEIRNDGGWRPLETKGKKAYEHAKFSSKVVSDAEWTLIETRENGDIRYFELTKDEKTNTLVVQLMREDGALANLKWHLVPINENQANQRFCKKCGNVLMADSAFCGKCGTEYKEAEQEREPKEEQQREAWRALKVATQGGSLRELRAAMDAARAVGLPDDAVMRQATDRLAALEEAAAQAALEKRRKQRARWWSDVESVEDGIVNEHMSFLHMSDAAFVEYLQEKIDTIMATNVSLQGQLQHQSSTVKQLREERTSKQEAWEEVREDLREKRETEAAAEERLIEAHQARLAEERRLRDKDVTLYSKLASLTKEKFRLEDLRRAEQRQMAEHRTLIEKLQREAMSLKLQKEEFEGEDSREFSSDATTPAVHNFSWQSRPSLAPSNSGEDLVQGVGTRASLEIPLPAGPKQGRPSRHKT